MSKKVDYTGAYFPPEEIASELETANDWAFYILNRERKSGISNKNFYKLFIYAKKLPELYGVPEEMQQEVAESILEALKTLAQM